MRWSLPQMGCFLSIFEIQILPNRPIFGLLLYNAIAGYRNCLSSLFVPFLPLRHLPSFLTFFPHISFFFTLSLSAPQIYPFFPLPPPFRYSYPFCILSVGNLEWFNTFFEMREFLSGLTGIWAVYAPFSLFSPFQIGCCAIKIWCLLFLWERGE